MGFAWLDGPVDKRSAPEAASQSFKKGDLIYLVAGAVTIIAADSKIAGVALQDASGVTGTIIMFHAIHPDQLWIAQLDTTTAQAYEGEDYGLNYGTAGSMAVDIGDTSTVAVVINQLDPAQAVGKDGGKVILRFKAAVCQMITG